MVNSGSWRMDRRGRRVAITLAGMLAAGAAITAGASYANSVPGAGAADHGAAHHVLAHDGVIQSESTPGGGVLAEDGVIQSESPHGTGTVIIIESAPGTGVAPDGIQGSGAPA